MSFAFPEQIIAVINSVLFVFANLGGKNSTRNFQQVKKENPMHLSKLMRNAASSGDFCLLNALR